MIPRLRLAYFAKDATILSVQSGPVADLYIIQRGLVGRRPDSLQADPDRTLGEGELFPVGALSAGGTTTKIFHALQDTSCYLLARDDFLELRRLSPEFERYCTQAITETLKLSLESLYRQFSQRAAEQQTLTRTLAELVRNPPVACPAAGDAARGGAEDGRRQGAHDRRRRPRGRADRHVHAGRPAAACRADRPVADDAARRRDDGADRHAAGIRDRVRGDARDGRARHPPDRRRRERPAPRRDQRARPLRAAAGVDARGDRGAARRRLDRQAEARRRRHPPAHAEPARAGRGRRAAHAHDRRAQRRAVAPGDRHRRGSGTPSPTSTGAGSRSAARAAASRRSRRTRTTRSCSPRPTPRKRRRGANGCSPSRATSTRASTGSASRCAPAT